MANESAEPEAAVVPAASFPHVLTCLRSFGRRGIHTIAAGDQPLSTAFRSRYCDERVAVPSPADDLVAYKDALLSLASRERVRAITPVRESDAYVLSKHRSEFEAHLRPLWPTFETLRTAQDRVRLVDAAEAAGVAVPETQRLDEVEAWDRRRVVKTRYSLLTEDYVESLPPERVASPNAVHFLEADEEPDRESIRAEMGHVPIAQEYVPGPEYALWALYDDGDPVATCQKRQIRAKSYAGGTSVYRETTRVPALEAAGRALLDHLDWHGFASVQFKRDAKTGAFTLMEINPRTWVSLSCPVRAGVDFPYYYWRRAGGEAVPDAACELGVGTHDLLGEAQYLRSVLRAEHPFVEPPSLPGAAWDLAASLYRHPHCEYLARDDPGPFARFVASVLADNVPLAGAAVRRLAALTDRDRDR
jgi:predicted ATP-grasp superfamily ATP-dependent carboligase